MIVVAFALFTVLILAWLAAPDGRTPRLDTTSMAEVPLRADSEGAVLTVGAD